MQRCQVAILDQSNHTLAHSSTPSLRLVFNTMALMSNWKPSERHTIPQTQTNMWFLYQRGLSVIRVGFKKSIYLSERGDKRQDGFKDLGLRPTLTFGALSTWNESAPSSGAAWWHRLGDEAEKSNGVSCTRRHFPSERHALDLFWSHIMLMV